MATSVSTSPSAKRPRSSWFLRVTTIDDISQFEIGFKNTRGDISSFSKSKASPKTPFGPPCKVEYLMKKIVDEESGEFKFTNKRRETVPFMESQMNNFNVDGGVNGFSRKITSLIVEKRQKLLAMYLSLLSHTDNFVHHREEYHDQNGFLLDGSGIQEKDLEQNGGMLVEFLEFVNVASTSAVTVEKEVLGNNPISNYFQVSQKRSQDSSSKSKKKSKNDLKNENEQKEIDDKSGLEQEYKKSYLGIAHIPLGNISVAPDLATKINPLRVLAIMNSITKKYDPSMSVLVVCPADIHKPVDLSDVDDEKFHCIQKIHTLEAFHKLDNDEKQFEMLASHSEKKVVCYVIKTSTSGLVHYGHLRPTSIETKFIQKIYPQHILHIFQSLAVDGNVNSWKVVERISRLCRIKANEATTISKLCKWSKEAFTALINVIELFEKYGTLDVKPSGHQGRLARGEKLPITNKLFNQLGKTDETYFLSGHGKVLSGEISLKCLIAEFGNIIKLEKVVATLCVIAGHKTYESIKLVFPGKFEQDQIKLFIGSEIKPDKTMNENALRLEKYYNAVKNKEPNALQTLLELNEFTDLKELKDASLFSQFNTIVLLMSKDVSEICLEIADYVIKSEDSRVSAILVFSSEALQFQFLSFLRSKDLTLLKNYHVSPIVISCEVKVQRNIEENVSFGVIFGKIDKFKSPVKIYQNSISNLKEIVESVSPPGGATLVVADQLPLVKVHSAELSGKVAYYGSKTEIYKFKGLLAKDGSFRMSGLEAEKISSEVVGSEASGSDSTQVPPSEEEKLTEMDQVKVDNPLKAFDYQDEMEEIEKQIDSDSDSFDDSLYD